MKKFAAVLVAGVAVLGLAGGLWYPAHAEEENEQIEHLPPAVRAAIEQAAAGGRIVEIEREVKHGEVVYEVEVRKGGREMEFAVTTAGKVLGEEMEDDDDDKEGDDGDDKDSEAGEEPIVFGDLPGGVQNTLNKTYAGIRFHDLSREIEDGHTIYEAAYEEGGSKRELSLTADGQVLSEEEAIDYNTLPPAVQLTLDQEYAGAKIGDTERVHVTFYEVEATLADGSKVEVKILPDGRIMEVEDDD